MSGRGSGSGRVSGGASRINRAARDPRKAAQVQNEIDQLAAERRELVNQFGRAEDANDEARMASLRKLINANDRERKNANKRYRYYAYGETF